MDKGKASVVGLIFIFLCIACVALVESDQTGPPDRVETVKTIRGEILKVNRGSMNIVLENEDGKFWISYNQKIDRVPLEMQVIIKKQKIIWTNYIEDWLNPSDYRIVIEEVDEE